MASNDLIVRIDATTAQFDRALGSAQKATLRYEAQLKTAQKAQAEFDAAVAASGASSEEAYLAQVKLGQALARTTEAEIRAGAAAKAAGEIQAASAAKAAAATEAAAAKVAAAQEKAAAAQSAALKKIGTIGGVAFVASALALGAAAKAAADFEQQLALIHSLLPEVQKSQTGALGEAAKGFTDIGVSATEAASGEVELVKAGISAKDIMGGALPAALNLAAAGQLDVGTAAGIAAQAMTQFQLAGKDLPHVADLLAAGADRALGSVQDLGEGLGYSGLAAHQLGISVDETVAVLAEFAQAGLIGSQGGTTLQQVLRQLTGPTSQAKDEIQALGLQIYDANGKFIGLASIAQQLHDKLGGLSQAQRDAALNTLFTSRAVRGATVLYQDGAAGVEHWQKQVEASGFAADQAKGKMDSLSGDLQKLKANVTNTAIDFGEQLQPALRATAQDLDAFVGFLGHLPGPLKEAAALTLAFTAAVGAGVFVYAKAKLALASLGTTVGVTGAKMAVGRGALVGLGIAAETLASQIDNAQSSTKGLLDIAGGAGMGAVFGPWGAAAGALGGALQYLTGATQATSQATAELKAAADGVASTLDKETGAVTAATRAALAKSLADGAAFDDAKRLGVSYDTVTQAALGSKSALAQLQTQGGSAVKSNGDLFGSYAQLLNIVDAQTGSFDESRRHLLQVAATTRLAGQKFSDFSAEFPYLTAGTKNLAAGAKNLAAGADDAAGSVDHLASSVRQLTVALQHDQNALSHRAALRDYADATKAVDDAQKKAKTTVRQANEALDAQASSALNVASTMKDGSQQQVAYLERARTALYQQARQFGATKEEARQYVDQVLQIPTSWKTRIDVDSQAALAKLHALQTAEEALRSKTVVIDYQIRQSGAVPGGHVVYTPAAGGYITGPGTTTSDSIPAWLSNGEFVQKAATVAREGVAKMTMLNEGRATIAPLQGFAGGGFAANGMRSLSGAPAQQVVMGQAAFPDRIMLVTDIGTFSAAVRAESRGTVLAYREHAAWTAKGGG